MSLLIVKDILSITATFITVVAYFPYAYAIIKGKIQPNIITWLVLTVIGAVNFFSYKEIGAVNALGIALANLIGPFIILILSCVKNGIHEEKRDLYYLFISGLAIVLWAVTHNAFVGLSFNLIADFAGFIPTIKKAYRKPKTEDLLTWTLFFIGGLFALASLEHYSVELLLYPLYIVTAEGVVFVLLLRNLIITKNR